MHCLETLKRINALPPRCRPGDLAVTILADHNINLGRIVRVIKRFDGTGEIHFNTDGPVWFVEGGQTMTWTVGDRLFMRKHGPVPDCRLQPIRGEYLTHSVIVDSETKAVLV